jgi:hypothetical protein
MRCAVVSVPARVHQKATRQVEQSVHGQRRGQRQRSASNPDFHHEEGAGNIELSVRQRGGRSARLHGVVIPLAKTTSTASDAPPQTSRRKVAQI